MGGAMGGVWVALLLLALSGPVQPQAGPLTGSLASGLDLLSDGDATGAQDGLSALHREYDKGWRHRVGSAAAEPSADDEDAEGDAGGVAKPAEDDAVPEDALPPKRRRYTRKRLRPQAQDDVEADASVAAKRKKPARDDDDEEHRRRKPGQRRRRPHRPDAEAAQDADAEDEARHIEGAAQPSVASPSDLKSLLKQTAGQLSLSELLQNRNLSLSDLLKGNRGALSALTAPHGHAAHANDAAPSAASSTAADAEDEPATERHNGFVPSKPRRLPPTPRPSAAPSPSSRPEPEPEVTTSRPRRLPAVVARVKAEQQAKGHAAPQADALDPMNPAMMAMIALEAADTHTSKPRRIPPPAATSTASPSTSSTTSTTTTTTRSEAAAPPTTPGTTTTTSAGTTLPPRDFYPLNVDSLEITTPRLMGVSKAAASKPAWLPPADRIIDAQVFSPGSIANKFRTHGFVASGEQALDRPEMTPPTTTTTSTLPPQPATLQNTSDHFRLENETLDLKEGNALDKRKIGSVPGRTEQNTTSSTSAQHAQHANELDKADKDKAEKRKPLIPIASTGPRRLPPTLAGTRRLPAALPTRPKTTTEPPAPERPRLPFLVNKRAKDKERERERDALLPPTRFALPLPEVISVEKMIADARSRGALEQGTTVSQSQASSERTTTTDAPAPSEASTSPSTSTTFASRDEILDLLKSEQSSTRLSRILAERNMTLEDLLQHRERGSSQLHFADFIRSDRNATSKTADEAKPIDLVPKEITPAERKDSVNILRSFHEVPKYPFAYSSAGEAADDSEEAASTLSLVNVKPAGIVLPADPDERYHHQRSAVPVAAAAPSRAPRVVVPQPQAPPPPPPPPPQPYPIPTFRLPEPPAHASNPYLVIKHVPDAQDAMTVAMTDTVPDRPDAVVLEHVGEIHQVGVSSSVEEAVVVDSVRDNVRHSDRPDRLDRLSLPSGVKSAIIASTVICGLAIVGFLTIFIVFRWRQKRALIRARGAILCEQLQRGSFRGRSLSPVLVNVSKSSQVQPMQHSGPVPYYSKKDLSSRATSNTASNRHYYLWRSLRKTFQEDDMD